MGRLGVEGRSNQQLIGTELVGGGIGGSQFRKAQLLIPQLQRTRIASGYEA